MILIIDDDTAVQAALRLLLRQHALASTGVETAQRARDFLAETRPDLVLLDMNFGIETSGQEGLMLLREILAQYPGLPVILITGWATLALAIEGMKAGARDFISKPWDNAHLLQSIQTALALSDHPAKSATRRQLDADFQFGHIIGEDPAFLRILETVGRVAPTTASVLILGESGTGKELIAEAIHENSNRSEQPFVKVNLGGISESLFESELFGHKKGAYTDAHYDRKGRFSMADQGTIFLDEIGELPAASQVKLLRVLQDRTFEVLGSSQPRKVDVRVVSATNRDLAAEVQSGHFREDLFYRINLITIHLPALRERPTDIPLLVDAHLRQVKKHYHRPGVTISDAALDWLQHYPFPGNIRQLKNLVERVVLVNPKERLEAEDFRTQLDQPAVAKSQRMMPAVGTLSLEEMEKNMILDAMKFHSNKISKVAQSLGITRSSLYRRLEKYNIPYD